MTDDANPADVADEKVNILIVDDRADKLLAHEVVLGDLNQNLVRARSGTEALAMSFARGFRGHPARRQHAGDGWI